MFTKRDGGGADQVVIDIHVGGTACDNGLAVGLYRIGVQHYSAEYEYEYE